VRSDRKRRRVGVFDATLAAPDGIVAVQRATVIRPQEDATLPVPPAKSVDPEQFLVKKTARQAGCATLSDGRHGDARRPKWCEMVSD
jgi:hypothetical protein